jgi:hypothetical protein
MLTIINILQGNTLQDITRPLQLHRMEIFGGISNQHNNNPIDEESKCTHLLQLVHISISF